ncbi:hypothetical protein DB30_06500 [Enhygromyxa salina]|uniref:Chromosome partition protein Smc n=1 Tax=Enhygromyxa salina TaxID=215803 RepID=A0A0C2CTX3_9BACT|nr:hypothetical protein [Enhygromyxa salina]KIG14621.1 hypothetical protein DB30_06500 [Enhygromyxa salina]
MSAGARVVLALGLALGLALVACKAPLQPATAPASDEPTLEQLYTAGRHGEVVLLATSIIDGHPERREAVAHARFFRALSWLAQGPRIERARGELELRTLELDHADSVWGKIAAAHASKILRADALQEALLELTLELRELERQTSDLEHALAEAEASVEQRDAKLATLEREREQLRAQLDAAQAAAKLAAGRILALEEELAALKQVDMQREP